MANQRPAWFRLSFVMRPPVPAPAPAPAPVPNNNNNPTSTLPPLRPSIPIRPPPPQTQYQEPPSVPPQPSIPQTVATPRFPVENRVPAAAPQRSPSPQPPVFPRPSVANPVPAAAPPRSPSPATTAAFPRPSVANPVPAAAPPRSPEPAAFPRTSIANPSSPTEVRPALIPPTTSAALRLQIPTPTPAVAQPRSKVAHASPTIVPPRSPVAQPSPTVTPSRSPVRHPASTIAPPRSPVPQPASTVAQPMPPVYPTSSMATAAPTRNVTSTPNTPGATRQPTATDDWPNSKVALSNYPGTTSSSPEGSPRNSTQSPIPNSPISKHVSNHSERTPAQSPKLKKPLARSPSPLTLPPAQLNESSPPKIEQKSVLVQETIDKTIKLNSPLTSNGKREPTKGVNKKHSDSGGMRIITLAGENKGAIMELGPSCKTNLSIGNPHRLNKTTSNDEEWSSESGEGGTRNKDKERRAMAKQAPPMSAYLNNNVQGINNSILYNFSCTHNDPGIHLSLNRKANGSRYNKE